MASAVAARRRGPVGTLALRWTSAAGQEAPRPTPALDATSHFRWASRSDGSGHHQRTLMRYGHDRQTCAEDDLRKLLWPGDYLARQLVDRVLEVLGRSPPPAYLAGLFGRYFMNASPDAAKMAKIKATFETIKNEFSANDYFYVCANDCDSSNTAKTFGKTKVSPVTGGSGPVILCMNTLRTQMRPVDWTAATIIHEFCHRYLGFPGDNYCEYSCHGLSEADALTNPDSFSNLALETWWAEDLAALKAKKKAQQGGQSP